jgi:hypothetical protein
VAGGRDGSVHMADARGNGLWTLKTMMVIQWSCSLTVLLLCIYIDDEGTNSSTLHIEVLYVLM